MKLVTWLAGLVAGIGAALAALFLSPMVPEPMVSSSGEPLIYQSMSSHGMTLRPGNLLALNSGRDALDDPANEWSRADVLLLANESGKTVALATRLESVGNNNDLAAGQLGSVSLWTVFWPNTGSQFAVSYNNFWPAAGDQLMRIVGLDEAFGAQARYPVTLLESAGDASELIGGSGALAGDTGMLMEVRSTDFESGGIAIDAR